MLNLLKSKNFCLLILGRFITNLGDSVYYVASMWLVYELTKDPYYTGLATSLIMIPRIFQFFIGPLVDKWNLKSILVYTEFFQFLLILIIPIAHYFQFLSVWLVLTVMFLAVCFNSFVYPAQSALLPTIIEKEKLPIANSLMTIANQGTDFILTALSGIIIIYIGAVNIYLIDAFTFLIAFCLFLGLKVPSRNNGHETNTKVVIKEKWSSYRMELVEGFQIFKNSFIPKMFFPLILANFIFGMINAILPDYSYLKGGQSFYGYYLAAMSIGLLLGAIIGPKLKNLTFGKIMIVSFFLSSITWFYSSITSNIILSLTLFSISLIALGIANVLIFSTLQTIIPEHLLGRVFSLLSSLAAITLPLGAFLGGYIATLYSSNVVYMFGFIATLFISIYWLVIPALRTMPAYTKINPENYVSLENFTQKVSNQ